MNGSAIRLAKHAGSWYPAQSKFLVMKFLEGILQKEME